MLMEKYELGTSNPSPIELDPSSFPIELLLVWRDLKWAFIMIVWLQKKKKANKQIQKKKRKKEIRKKIAKEKWGEGWGGLKEYI